MPRRKVTTIGSGRFLRLVQDGSWEFAERAQSTGVVAIVAVTEHDELVLIEQYRPPIHMKCVELPAGLAGDVAGQEQEAFEEAARRELIEETGFAADELEHVFSGPSSAGLTNEMIAFFLARNVRKVSDGGGDESEEIQVHVVPLKKLRTWLRRKSTSRTCIDPKIYAGLGILAGAFE